MLPRSAARSALGFLRTLILPAWVVLLIASCARLPNAPGSPSAGTATPRSVQGSTPSSLPSGPARVIVRLAPDASASVVAAAYGSTLLASVPELWLHLLQVPAGETQSGFIRKLASDPRVQFAEPDYAAQTAEGRQSTMAFSEGWRSWPDVVDQAALTRIDAPAAHLLATGRDVLVAVLDTGVDLDHPVLAGHLDLPGVEPGVEQAPADDRAQTLDTNGDGVLDGSLGHGTHVAGIIHAVAPAARILAVRVLDSDGVGYAFAIVRGLVAAVNRGARVANLSLGLETSSMALAAGVDYARAAGVIVVAPTGNADSEAIEIPAAIPSVTAVAGTDDGDRKAPFSSYGVGTDLAAPAVGILSTYVGGGYASWSGTSMAAPFVAGVAALVYEWLGPRSADSAAEVERALHSGAVPLGAVDLVYGALLGAGRVSALGSLEATPGPVSGSPDVPPRRGPSEGGS